MKKFGKWRWAGKSRPGYPPHFKKEYFVTCKCGVKKWVRSNNLLTGRSSQCKRCGNITHGASIQPSTPPLHRSTYRSWQDMHQRCYKKTCAAYKDYGARGIRVCKRWSRFEAFQKDMGWKPTLDHTIERKDFNADYKPSNCEWIHRSRQSRNNRRSVFISYKGERLCIADWADKLGISRLTIRTRIKRGWSIERALTEPTGK